MDYSEEVTAEDYGLQMYKGKWYYLTVFTTNGIERMRVRISQEVVDKAKNGSLLRMRRERERLRAAGLPLPTVRTGRGL